MELTLSEAVVLRSVRKYFIDTFKEEENLPVFFDYVERTPTKNGKKVNRWMCVIPRGTTFGTLATSLFQIHIFVTKDKDAMDVALFRDLIADSLIDLEETDGALRFPFYDEDWEIQFYGVVKLHDSLNPSFFEDGTKSQIIPFSLFWGAK